MELENFSPHRFVVDLIAMHYLGELSLKLLHVGLLLELFLLHLLQKFLDGLF